MNNLAKKDGVFSTAGSLVDDFFTKDLFSWNNRSLTPFRSSVPSANIEETETVYCIDLAVPGLKKSDFRIELNDKILSVQTEHQEDAEDQSFDGTYQRREFSFHSFYRTFRLPEAADCECINASYNDGILHIEIAKRTDDLPKSTKKIDVD
jgi:HSP20 family protein